MLIVENRFKTFFRLLWDKIKIIFWVIGVVAFIVGSSFILCDFTPSENKNTIEKLEIRVEVLEKIHKIDIREEKNE